MSVSSAYEGVTEPSKKREKRMRSKSHENEGKPLAGSTQVKKRIMNTIPPKDKTVGTVRVMPHLESHKVDLYSYAC